MGEKKRKPLRAREPSDNGAGRRSKSAKIENIKADAAQDKIGVASSKDKKASKKAALIAETDEWELIENQQSASDGANIGSMDKEQDRSHNDDDEDDDDDDEDDDDDDEDEIKLEGSIEHVTEKYTFEFNDMREEYTEGVCVLLRSFVQNPTKAYELAKAITSQSMYWGVVENSHLYRLYFAFLQSKRVISRH